MKVLKHIVLWDLVMVLPTVSRIIEALRLEKSFNVMKSNRQPNTTMPVKPCPEVSYLHVF